MVYALVIESSEFPAVYVVDLATLVTRTRFTVVDILVTYAEELAIYYYVFLGHIKIRSYQVLQSHPELKYQILEILLSHLRYIHP